MIEIIQKAIEGGWDDLPKGDTIELCKESVITATVQPKLTTTKLLKLWSVLDIIGTSKNTEESSVTKKHNNVSKPLNLNGLANTLGITKEGVTRLIWLLEDARSIKDGSGQYSSETISLVKNALLKERILKQTTSLLDSPLSWTKKESQHTSKQWRVKDYGIKTMDAPFVVNVIGV